MRKGRAENIGGNVKRKEILWEEVGSEEEIRISGRKYGFGR